MNSEAASLTAFLAGLASFISPCVFPLLPLYMSVIAPKGQKKGESLRSALFFVSGFTLVFVLMGLTASALGSLLFEYQDALRKAGGIFMVLMGLLQLGVFTLPTLARDWRPFLTKAGNSNGGTFVLGMAFVFGWIPCTGPVLSAILMYAGVEASLHKGFWLLLAYSAGFGVPLIAMAVATETLAGQFRSTLLPALAKIQTMSGLILVVIGVMLYFDWLTRLITMII